MKTRVYLVFLLIYLATVVSLSILTIILVRNVSRRITIQIVRLHDIIKNNLKQQRENLTLSYLA